VITRRHVLLAGALSALIARYAGAQASPVRIGILSPRSLHTSFMTPAVIQRLAALGYREGAGAILEYRSAEDQIERYPQLARELINARGDIIFAMGPEAAVTALRQARVTVPVVFYASEYDPVAAGIVKTLARPEGNFTGVYVPQNALVAKRLELMRETVPSVRHPEQPYDFAGAFEKGKKVQVDGFLMLSSPSFATHLGTCLALLEKYRLPAVGAIVFAEKGLLLGYGPHATQGARRAAELGARILKGAKPADIPVEQDDNFELVINAKAAKMLGVKLPESVRARAVRIVS
jgi:putative ABC transport system substrate-binding protein